MAIQWWQVLLLSLYAGYQILDELQFYSSISAPVFAGLFAGLVMGDIKTGLLIGGSMQLTVLGVGTFGGASRIDANSGTVLATAFSVSLGWDPEQAIATIAVPVAALMIQMDILGRFTNTYFAHRIDAHVENFNYKGIERNYLAGAVLPAVGFAILLRYLPVKKHFPYLILGFVLTALLTTVFGNIQFLGASVASVVEEFSGVFNSLPMLGIAAIGFSLAAISYKNHINVPVVQSSSNSSAEGEIEDDEI